MTASDAEVPSYVRGLLKQVIEGTGYRVAIEEAELLEFDSEVRYASPESPIHHIRVGRAFRESSHALCSFIAGQDRAILRRS
jgi:hypothetical protein